MEPTTPFRYLTFALLALATLSWINVLFHFNKSAFAMALTVSFFAIVAQCAETFVRQATKFVANSQTTNPF